MGILLYCPLGPPPREPVTVTVYFMLIQAGPSFPEPDMSVSNLSQPFRGDFLCDHMSRLRESGQVVGIRNAVGEQPACTSFRAFLD